MITNRIINRLLLLIRVPIECRGTMPSYCAHVATPKDAHAHGARARMRMVRAPRALWGGEWRPSRSSRSKVST